MTSVGNIKNRDGLDNYMQNNRKTVIARLEKIDKNKLFSDYKWNVYNITKTLLGTRRETLNEDLTKLHAIYYPNPPPPTNNTASIEYNTGRRFDENHNQLPGNTSGPDAADATDVAVAAADALPPAKRLRLDISDGGGTRRRSRKSKKSKKSRKSYKKSYKKSRKSRRYRR